MMPVREGRVYSFTGLDKETFKGLPGMLADSLLVSVENPKRRLTTVENAPIDPSTWTVTQSGGKDGVVTSLDNGLQLDFTGASSRNPYIKLSKAVQIWGLPDTLRLRLRPNGVQVKSVKVLVETAYDERITVERPVDASDGEIVIDLPVTDLCDAADLGNFPLHLVYIYITHNAVTAGVPYSFQIPGMELVYACMPPDGPQPLTGDVNGDGEVNIADINTVIDMILSGNLSLAGDVNGDGEVNIADVNALIDMILS